MELTHKVLKNWSLWTIWSKITRENVTAEELTNSIIDLVKQQDKTFATLSSDVIVIKPIKTTYKNNNNEDGENTSPSHLEIVGTLFQPGEKISEEGGETWTVILTNELALLLASDKSLCSSNHGFLIIWGGFVNHSSRQISLDLSVQRRVTIIRSIGNVSGLPEIKEIGSIKTFKKPYHINSSEILNIFKPRRNDSIVLKTFPQNCNPNIAQKTTLKSNSKPDMVPSATASSQRKALNPFILLSSRTNKIQKPSVSSSNFVSAVKSINTNVEIGDVNTNLTNNEESQTSNEVDCLREPFKNQNINTEYGKSGGFFPESDDEDGKEVVNDDEDDEQSTSRKIIRLETKEHDKYKYYKLNELEKKLLEDEQGNQTENWNSCVLQQANIWAVVDEVIQAPTEAEFKEQRLMHKSFKYLLRVSDEKKSNVLARLCTAKRLYSRKFNSIHEIGPMMKPLDIIRIHRATVQAENVGGVKEMVVSTTPHLNYTLFNHDPDVHSKIDHRRLAKKSDALHPGDDEHVKFLRCFSLYRRDKSDSNTSGPILSSGSSANSQTNKQQNNEKNNVSSKNSPGKSIELDERENDSSKNITGKATDEEPHSPEDNVESNKDFPVHKISTTNNASHNGMNERVEEIDNLNQDKQTSLDHSEHVLSSQEIRTDQFQNVPNTEYTLQLQDISFSLDATFSISGRLCDMMQIPEDQLVIRISDGTKLRVPVKKLIPNESQTESEFVDIKIQNLSANPYILDDIQMRIGSYETVLLSPIRAQEIIEDGRKMIQLSTHSRNFLMQ